LVDSEPARGVLIEHLQTLDAQYRVVLTLKYIDGLPVSEIADLSWDLVERERAQEEVRALNTELEKRVEQRTAELTALNEVLFDATATDADLVKDYVHQSPVVFSTERIDRVLPRLRASRNPISIVVNPEGQHVGIITIEDIVEEIVGDVEG